MSKKNKTQTISVTLASYNNEDTIAKCLDSISGWVDEIVIVDGHSTDKTVEIAKKYGAKVLLRENNPIFHVQKQTANDTAKSDWILQLDTDEVVSEELKREIKKIIKGEWSGLSGWISPVKSFLNRLSPIFPKPFLLSETANAYWLPRKNFFLGGVLKHSGQYPDPVIRLFKNKKAYLPAKSVHEQMVVQDNNLGWLTSDLYHYGTPNFARYLLREDRYSSLTATELKKEKVKIGLFNTAKYLIFLPTTTFLKLFIRYRGFLDGFPGFVFALYSGLHFAFAYMKLWEAYKKEDLAIK